MLSNPSEPTPSAISGGIGQAACGIVHDLANLLQTILLRAEVTAATENVSPICAKRLEQIVEDGKISADIIRSLLEYARKEVDGLSPVDLAPTIRAAVENAQAANFPARVVTRLPDYPFPVRSDPAQIADLVGILLKELAKETTEATTITVQFGPASEAGTAATSSLWMEEAGWVALSLTREGPGAAVDFEEGALPQLAGKAQIEPHQMDVLRARGIVRQHRGQLHASEAVDDQSKKLSIQVLWPGGQINSSL
jgi:signal transduction histidine kinase